MEKSFFWSLFLETPCCADSQNGYKKDSDHISNQGLLSPPLGAIAIVRGSLSKPTGALMCMYIYIHIRIHV